MLTRSIGRAWKPSPAPLPPRCIGNETRCFSPSVGHGPGSRLPGNRPDFLERRFYKWARVPDNGLIHPNRRSLVCCYPLWASSPYSRHSFSSPPRPRSFPVVSAPQHRFQRNRAISAASSTMAAQLAPATLVRPLPARSRLVLYTRSRYMCLHILLEQNCVLKNSGSTLYVPAGEALLC